MVILSRAPVVSPRYLEIRSVAQHSLSASGIIARQLRTKTTESLHPRWGASTPAGTKISRRLLQFLTENLAAALSFSLQVGAPGFSRSTGNESRASYKDGVREGWRAHRQHKQAYRRQRYGSTMLKDTVPSRRQASNKACGYICHVVARAVVVPLVVDIVVFGPRVAIIGHCVRSMVCMMHARRAENSRRWV